MQIFNLICVFLLVFSANSGIFQKHYEQALLIAKDMTLDQKLGQLIQADFGAIANSSGMYPQKASQYNLGSLLIGGNGAPNQNGDLVTDYGDQQQNIVIYSNATMEKWQKMAAKFNYTVNVTGKVKDYFIKTILATDAVHNNQHVAGTILFPHNSGLSNSHNPDHFFNLGKWTGKNVKESGFNYAFAPTVAVSHNPQWGRFYETMGSDSALIKQYAKAYTEGLQGKGSSLTGVIGSVKHFIGDGATMYGADEGNVHVSNYSTFLDHNVQGYIGAVEADIGTVMCSYSAINWVPMAISPMIPDIMRNKLKFDGFVISDYDELGRIVFQHLPTSFQTMKGINESVAMAINAGIDMMMIPPWNGEQNIVVTMGAIKEALENNAITEERLNDAIARILSVKISMGLVSSKIKGEEKMTIVGKENEPNLKVENEEKESVTSEYEDSLNAVHESLVLLKNNNNILPLKTENLDYIVFVGQKIISVYGSNHLYQDYNNIGLQCGGWSLRWQGFLGNGLWEGQNKIKTNATSILDALTNLKQKFQPVYPKYTSFTDTNQIQQDRDNFLSHLSDINSKMNSQNTVIMAAVGEPPFAEFAGDVGIPYCKKDGPLSDEGCMYSEWLNPYLNGDQRSSLSLAFSDFDLSVITKVREHDSNIPIITTLFAGRPMFIADILDKSEALIDAFLPGTSGGQGVIDAITGRYVVKPSGTNKNTLAFDWPSTTESLQDFPVYKIDGKIPRIPSPLFSQGYGLSTAK